MAKYLSSMFAICLAWSATAQEESVPAGGDAPVAEVEGPAADGSGDLSSDSDGLQVFDAADVSLDDFLWTHRPIVVFADTPADPRFREQLELLHLRPAGLNLRDVVVITDTDPDARNPIRLKLRPRGFQLTLIAKDGKVNLRKPFPWDVREISHAIDKWPLRKQEIRARTGG